MTAEHQVADPTQGRPAEAPTRLRATNATLLCGLWIAVIVLAVAIDLAK